jgi:hypothetical protein
VEIDRIQKVKKKFRDVDTIVDEVGGRMFSIVGRMEK